MRYKQKHAKEMKWSLNAKIIDIYSKDIELDDDTIKLSVFRP